ncbi:tetratricopeptide repeat protein [Pedobacter lithocola]|uniref:Tetratricopeptide repeat protein n=1 Tax=Pedobacter lithocola TaxID=1908239 RepID=A0ABV8PFD3_9SPHI
MKKIFLIHLILLINLTFVFAQSSSIKDLYWDYTMIRMTDTEKPKAIALATDVLKHSSELTPKQIANVTYHLGRLYEETNQMPLAIPYYEKSIQLTPGYYVPYLALGNYYFKNCKDLIVKMNAAAEAKDLASHTKLTDDYKKLATKVAAYLERSYACDPDDDTMNMITYLYQTSKNPTALTSLDDRIKKLAEGCITLLDDE